MAPSDREARPQFSQPVRQITMMLIASGLAGFGAFVALPRVLPVFLANLYLNGFIFAVFVIGVLACFWQVSQLIGSVRWIEQFAAGEAGPQNRPPQLLAPLASLLRSRGARMQLSATSSRSILDSVAQRIDEEREITRYIVNLLIFLGLLGTFWGLLQVVGNVGDAVRAVSASSTGAGETDAMALMSAIEEPIAGMGTAFASSLFGLAGSLIIGFLELQASRAQNRFYNEVEEWLSSISRLANAGPQGASADEAGGSGAYVGALLEQSADALDRLTHTLERHTRQLETIMTRFADDAAESQRESARLLRDEIKVLVRALEAQARLNRERGQDRDV